MVHPHEKGAGGRATGFVEKRFSGRMRLRMDVCAVVETGGNVREGGEGRIRGSSLGKFICGGSRGAVVAEGSTIRRNMVAEIEAEEGEEPAREWPFFGIGRIDAGGGLGSEWLGGEE